MNRFCVDCARSFDALGDWQKRCRDCYKRHKAREVDRVYEQGYRCGFDAGYAAGRFTAGPALSTEQLRALVQLCHPDRHPPERAALANRATARLLELIQEGRAA